MTQSIVIVEDEGIAAEDIRRRLESWGFLVPAVVATGEEAIASAERVRPDLVLMDIHLKGCMDGVEAANSGLIVRYGGPVLSLPRWTSRPVSGAGAPESTGPVGSKPEVSGGVVELGAGANVSQLAEIPPFD